MKKLLFLLPILIIGILLFKLIKEQIEPYVFTGTVEGNIFTLSSRLPSTVKSIYFREGEHVNKGDTLIKLSCEDIENRFNNLSSEYNRASKLKEKGAISNEAFDKISFSFTDVKIKKEWCEIKSPVSGIVLDNHQEIGEFSPVGAKVISILEEDNYWVYFYIPQIQIHKINLGQKVMLTLPEAKKEFEGIIQKINSIAEFTPKNVQTFDERARLVYGVKIKLVENSELLKPGMSLDLKLEK